MSDAAQADAARFDAASIASRAGGELIGDPCASAWSVDGLDSAHAGSLTFVRDEKHARLLVQSPASVAIVSRSALEAARPAVDAPGRAIIAVDDADRAMLALLDALRSADPYADEPAGVHPSASVHETAEVDETASVGANATIGANVRIGAHTVIAPGVRVLRGCVIGSHCTLHANAVIGAEGFGFIPDPDAGVPLRVPHIGNVEIGDHVEIGAGTCVDRGKFGPTRIGDHTKIDNLCQIGHNVQIGRGCILCGLCGLAGSVKLEDGVTLAAGVGIADNLVIGRGATLGARSGVMHNVPAGETWLGAPAMPGRSFFRFVANMQRLSKKQPRRDEGEDRTRRGADGS
jgi:UDP-3-O-[3-hydroxymyristoyl] glucosamine N-acyltransferase